MDNTSRNAEYIRVAWHSYLNQHNSGDEWLTGFADSGHRDGGRRGVYGPNFILFLIVFYFVCPGCNASYEMQGPSFVSEPPSRVEFTNVNGGRVDCTVRGNPAPTVDWLGADGGSITNIPGIRHVLGNGTIHFPGFEAEAFRQDVHWAIYKCSAANSVGAVVSRDVTVRAGMPTVKLLPRYPALSKR
ncbi:Down syndrome cell adhesion molecule-like protein Dscam2 isoform X1 [Vespula maculifrons]|uniref:Down syndrome cell adhesion molecule-like protein Dscam2 isoform X1 n=1 Tax=Vespula maculifrons TaxID=7453 RepID=A0ABD2B8K7_VESMC